jgi:hypothetical protein
MPAAIVPSFPALLAHSQRPAIQTIRAKRIVEALINGFSQRLPGVR